jgi:hypothetical protein
MAGTTGARRWLPLRLAVIALVVLVAVVVAILARPTQEDLVLTSYPGVPADADPPPTEDGEPSWEPGWILGADGRLAVYAAGSSSCPPTPTAVVADGDHVTVTLEVLGDPCTADLAWTTHVVALPAGVDPGAVEVEIVVDG